MNPVQTRAIAVIGLGRLGAPLAAVLAAHGNHVIGVDLNSEVVDAVNAGRPPVEEPGLSDMMARASGRLTATKDLAAAVSRSEISMVVVPTPSDPTGAFSNDHVLSAVSAIGAALGPTAEHLVVIVSTVMPGSTGGPIQDALDSAAGRQVPLCYSPEFIALGSVLRDLQEPDVILVGEDLEGASDPIVAVLGRVTGGDTPVRKMSTVSAELAKLAVNTFVTTKISFANMIGDICSRLPGSDVDAVLGAVGSDRRIGHSYLRAGAPYGGPCFPRDNLALSRLAESIGARADLAVATDALNRQHASSLSELVDSSLPSGGTVAILGLAYKPGTPVVDESFGIEVARTLFSRGIRLVLHDADATETAARVLESGPTFTTSLDDALREADVVVVTIPAPEYDGLLGHPALRGAAVVIDCWAAVRGGETSAQVLRPGRPALISLASGQTR